MNKPEILIYHSMKFCRAVIGGAGVFQNTLQSIRLIAAAPEMQRFRDNVSGSAAVHIGDSTANGLQRAVYGSKAVHRVMGQIRS